MNPQQGPNVKKLITRFMAVDAIPSGGGLADGIAFFKDPDRITATARACTKKAFDSIDAVKAAPDNPWGEDDETIAGVILEEIEKKKASR